MSRRRIQFPTLGDRPSRASRVALSLALPLALLAAPEPPGRPTLRAPKEAATRAAPAGAWVPADCAARALELAAVREDALQAGDCRIRDFVVGSAESVPAHLYRVNVETPVVWQASVTGTGFRPAAFVLDGAQRVLASALSTQGEAARVGISLRPGEYLLLVATRDNTGSYKLEASPEPPLACQETALAPGEDQRGELGATDCRVADLDAPSTDGRRLDLFTLPVKEPGVLTLEMRGEGFTGFLEVRSVEGTVTGSRAGSLAVSLPPGEYRIRATSTGAALGAYTLRGEWGASRTCEFRAVSLGDSVTGDLTAEDCRVLDLRTPSAAANRLDAYRFKVDEFGYVALDLSSTAFDAYLWLLDATGKVLVEDDNSGGSFNASILVSLPPGEYVVYATHAGASGGAYRFRTAYRRARPCTVETIALPGNVSARLTQQDCQTLEFVPFTSDLPFLRVYEMRVERRGMVTIEQNSTEVDAFVGLLAADKRVVAFDDDSGGAGNARLSLQLDPGSYFVLASSYDVEVGAFTLRTSFADARDCPAGTAELGASLSGRIETGDCRLRDLLLEVPAGNLARQYTVTVAEAGRLVADVASGAFPPVGVLLDPRGRLLDVESLRAPGIARLEARVEPGVYTVIAASAVEAGGDFTLRTLFQLQP